MSQSEQLERMRIEILGDATDSSKDEVFKIMLDDAEVVALNTLYPYDKEKDIKSLPNNKRYQGWQVRCAIELYGKIGNSNIFSYTENGLSVTYLSSLVSNSLMNELGPAKAGVIR